MLMYKKTSIMNFDDHLPEKNIKPNTRIPLDIKLLFIKKSHNSLELGTLSLNLF